MVKLILRFSPGGDPQRRFGLKRLFGAMPGNPLDFETIATLIAATPPLLEHFPSLESQLQPNGFDLTLREISRLTSPGQIGASGEDRILSDTEPLEYGPGGWAQLAPGPYLLTFNETVNLPLDLMALGRPRSSLLRSGAAIHTAVWDAGYHGRSQALLVVYNPQGFRVQRDARLLQLVFFRLEQPVRAGYQGRYLGEGL